MQALEVFLKLGLAASELMGAQAAEHSVFELAFQSQITLMIYKR